jgi:hypothetical protein
MNNYTFEDETDNESYVSWNETDNEDEDDPFEYEPEEPSTTKFNIVICEKYNELRHGVSTNEMNSHYLTLSRINRLDMGLINLFITNNNSNCRLEIAECIYLPSYHCVSIIKTFWLKLVQRTWKRIYKDRKLCISKRAHPNAHKYREIYGKWPKNCANYPQLKGMLFNLSRTSSS